MANEQRVPVTEKVSDLDGQKVLVIQQGERIVGVQTATIVAARIDNLGVLLDRFDEGLAKPDAEHLAAATARIDDRIADLEKRKAALTVDGVATAAKAGLTQKRLAIATARSNLVASLADMGGDPRPTIPVAPERAPAPE